MRKMLVLVLLVLLLLVLVLLVLLVLLLLVLVLVLVLVLLVAYRAGAHQRAMAVRWLLGTTSARSFGEARAVADSRGAVVVMPPRRLVCTAKRSKQRSLNISGNDSITKQSTHDTKTPLQ
jgi:hypothetical protein